jgi:hypothetical protein
VAKTWVLDTETKGTGAHIAPLTKRGRGADGERELALVDLERPGRQTPPQAPPEPLRFKVVDVMSSEVLAEGVSAREAVEVLEGMRSVIDARISVWAPERNRCRLLALEEAKALWSFRGRLDALRD